MQFPTQHLLNEHARHCLTGRRVQVIFGSPRHDCRYMGVCRIEPDPWDGLENDNPTCLHSYRATAYLIADVYGRLQLHFLRSSLGSATLDRYFPRENFVVQDAFILPDWLKSDLGLEQKPPYAIAPSYYPVLDTGGFLTVSARLMMRTISPKEGLQLVA